MTFNIGTLDRFVTLERAVTSSDGQGGRVTTWTTVAQFWAQLTPLAAREAVQGMAMRATLTHRVRCWFREDVREADRLTYDGRRFEVIGQREIGLRAGLELDVVEAR